MAEKGILTQDQRNRIAEQIMQMGNLVFLGTVVAQIFPGPLSKPSVALAGIGFTAAAYWIAIRVMKGGGKK